MILGPKKSQRRDLFFQKNLNERRNKETDKDFEIFAKIFEKLEIFTERPLDGRWQVGGMRWKMGCER